LNIPQPQPVFISSFEFQFCFLFLFPLSNFLPGVVTPMRDEDGSLSYIFLFSTWTWTSAFPYFLFSLFIFYNCVKTLHQNNPKKALSVTFCYTVKKAPFCDHLFYNIITYGYIVFFIHHIFGISIAHVIIIPTIYSLSIKVKDLYCFDIITTIVGCVLRTNFRINPWTKSSSSPGEL